MKRTSCLGQIADDSKDFLEWYFHFRKLSSLLACFFSFSIVTTAVKIINVITIWSFVPLFFEKPLLHSSILQFPFSYCTLFQFQLPFTHFCQWSKATGVIAIEVRVHIKGCFKGKQHGACSYLPWTVVAIESTLETGNMSTVSTVQIDLDLLSQLGPDVLLLSKA